MALPVLHAWRILQIQRLSGQMRTLADKYAEKDDLPRALAAADWYRRARPADPAGLARVAILYRKQAVSAGELLRAHTLLSQAQGADPHNQEVRAFLAELELSRGDFPAAQEQAEWLLDRDPNHSAASRVAAIVAWRMPDDIPSEKADLIPLFSRAVELNPDDIGLASVLAELYRHAQPPKPDLADETLDRLVKKLPKSPEAHLARALYRDRNTLPGVDEDTAQALELDANHAGALAMAAQRSARAGRWDDARGFYERLLQIEPNNPAHYLDLVKSFWALKQFAAATNVCRRAMVTVPDSTAEFGLLLAETLLQAGKLDEAESEIQSLADVCDRLQTRHQLSAEQADKLRSRLELMRAGLQRARGQADSAIARLKRLRTSATDDETRAGAHVQLATAYAEQLQWNLAAAEYEKAAELSPSPASLQLRAGQAWNAAGQPERAAKVLALAIASEDAPPSAHAWLAQALLEQQLQLPPANRDWQEFEQALARARDANAESDLVIWLTARHLELQGHTEEALRLLATGYQSHLTSRPWFSAYISLLGRAGKIDEMQAVVEEFSRRTEDPTLTNVARAAMAGFQSQPRDAEVELLKALQSASTEERPDILRRLALARLAQGHIGDAREALLEWHAGQPHSAGPLLLLAQLALAQQDWPAAEAWEKQLQAAEGSSGTQWRYVRAKLLLAQAADASEDSLKQPAKLLRELEQRRSDWSKTLELRGDLASRRQQWDLAVESDLQAFSLGERSPDFLARLLANCYRQERTQAAADVLHAIVSDNAQADAEILLAAIVVQFQKRRQFSEAIRLTESCIEWRPDDPAFALARVNLLFLAGRDADAEAALTQTLEQHATDEKTWGATLRLLAETGHLPQLRATMQQLRVEPALSKPTRAFLLAEASLWLGNLADMDRMGQAGLQSAPDDVDLHRRLARLYQAGQMPETTERLLRRVVELAPDSPADRRQLIHLLIEQGGAQRWREAADLLASLNPQDQNSEPGDLRLAALLETRSNGPRGVPAAIAWLEKLQAMPLAATAIDRFQLADLYESAGRIDDAERTYASLRDSQAATPAMLADYADFLLRNHRDATAVIEQLESLAANSPGTVRLRARWLHEQDRDAEIEALFEQFLTQQNLTSGSSGEPSKVLPDPQQRTELLLSLADECAALGLSRPAERWYRAAFASQPSEYRSLAVFLTQHDRPTEGVELGVQAFEQQPSAATARVLLEVLAQCDAPPSLAPRTESLLASELAKPENFVGLLPLLAEVRARQGQFDQAIEIYRRLLAQRPNDFRLLNNLAHHLAELPGKQDEALAAINQAIEVAGRQAKLMATLAHVYLARGEAEQAVAALEEIAAGSRAEPMQLLSLAVARAQSGDETGAKQSLQQALDHGLQINLVPAREQPLVQELLAKLPR